MDQPFNDVERALAAYLGVQTGRAIVAIEAGRIFTSRERLAIRECIEPEGPRKGAWKLISPPPDTDGFLAWHARTASLVTRKHCRHLLANLNDSDLTFYWRLARHFDELKVNVSKQHAALVEIGGVL